MKRINGLFPMGAIYGTGRLPQNGLELRVGQAWRSFSISLEELEANLRKEAEHRAEAAEKKLKQLEKIANAGDSRAQVELALMKYLPDQHKCAFGLFKQSAKQGNPEGL